VEEPAPKQARRQPSQQTKIISYVIIGVCVVLGALILIGSHGSGGSYSASVTGVTPVDPSTASVSFDVTNNGTTSSKPSCTIGVQDPHGSGTGGDEFQLSSSLAPGESTSSADSVTITNQDAQQATQANISCR
jgi:hypothetical protein